MCRRYLAYRLRRLEYREIGRNFAIERMKQVLELAGASALAAVLHGRIPIRDGDHRGRRVGGNIDVARLGGALAAAAPLPGVAAVAR